MKDAAYDPDDESEYECLDCGAIVVGTAHPGTCEECGVELRNTAMPLE